MIYTVTFNPSLDYIITLDAFEFGRTNRTTSELMLPGGKGVNVSVVLKNLGIDSVALGFDAGFVGDEIRRRIRELGIVSEFIRIPEGVSRINVKLRDFDGTELNGMGPAVAAQELEQLLMRISLLGEGDTLVLAGSIPSRMPESLYRDILARLEGRGVQTVVDATGQLLLQTLPFRPFLIKPNNHELGELFGAALTDRSQIAPYARKLQERGARNVLVSMGGQGAVLVAEDGSVHQAPAPRGTLVNAVGAGDSMVAGFLAGWAKRQDYRHAFSMAVAAGSASAFSELLATRPEVEAVYNRLEVSAGEAI
ncbi:MAG: 1-phosphofructokinase [Eubacteriales bacterium]|nr:1-phosphofructokinase [Eubacteriales bacterium]